MIIKLSFSCYVVQSSNNCAVKNAFSSTHDMACRNLANPVYFQQHIKSVRKQQNWLCFALRTLISLSWKESHRLFFFSFLKKRGIRNINRQPESSRVFVFPLESLAWSQSEWGLGTMHSSALLGSSKSCVPAVNSCPSVTGVHLFWDWQDSWEQPCAVKSWGHTMELL